jgi:hypothetical protein
MQWILVFVLKASRSVLLCSTFYLSHPQCHLCVESEKAAKRKALAARPLAIGDKVRVKKSVVTPRHGWGSYTHASVVVITQIHDSSGGYASVNPVSTNGSNAGVSGFAIALDELERVPEDDSDDDDDISAAKAGKGSKAGKAAKAGKAGKDKRGASGKKEAVQSKPKLPSSSASSARMPPAELQTDFAHFCARLLVARVSAGRSRGRDFERAMFDLLKINARAQYVF